MLAFRGWQIGRRNRSRNDCFVTHLTACAALAGCLALGVAWASWRAELRLTDTLPVAWEGRDIELTGTVAELPEFKVPRSQVTTAPPWHAPWLGVALTNVTPFGRLSIKVAGVAASGPALLIVSV